jgi:hypothetical protein
MTFELTELNPVRATGIAAAKGRFVAAFHDGAVLAWDGEKGKRREVMRAGPAQTLAVAFDPSASRLALLQFPDDAEPLVIVFDANTLNETHRVSVDVETEYRDTVSLVWLDADRVAFAENEAKAVTVVHLDTGKVQRLKGGKVTWPLAIVGDLLVAGGEKQLKAWRLPKLDKVVLERPKNRQAIDCVATRGDSLATLSNDDLVVGDEQKKATQKVGPGFWCGNRALGGLFFSPDGRRAVMTAWGKVLVVNLESDAIEATHEGRGKDFTHVVADGADLVAFDMGGGALRWKGLLT